MDLVESIMGAAFKCLRVLPTPPMKLRIHPDTLNDLRKADDAMPSHLKMLHILADGSGYEFAGIMPVVVTVEVEKWLIDVGEHPSRLQ